MKKPLQNLAFIISIAAAYFISVYFAMAALASTFALQTALVVLIFALITLLILDIDIDSRGVALGLVVTLPFSCFIVGVIWWVLRLLSLF